MSTRVPMPVRMLPPPPEIGEIISPGCAALVTMTPLNGARMIVLSAPREAMASWSCDTRTARRSEASRAARESRSAMAASSADAAISCRAASSRCRLSVRSARVSWACDSANWDCAAATCDCASSFCASASEGSSVARTWPAVTRWPSSIITSRTLPVIFDETVAIRRAVTKPEASSTLAGPPSAAERARAVSTSTGRIAPITMTMATTSTSAPTIQGQRRRFFSAPGRRSMRSSWSRSAEEAMVCVSQVGGRREVCRLAHPTTTCQKSERKRGQSAFPVTTL